MILTELLMINNVENLLKFQEILIILTKRN